LGRDITASEFTGTDRHATYLKEHRCDQHTITCEFTGKDYNTTSGEGKGLIYQEGPA
jgi:hypothetical protein